MIFLPMKALRNLFIGLAMVVLIPRLEAQPVITQQPANQLVLVENAAAFGVSVSGSGLFGYQWQFNGTNLPQIQFITTVAGNGILSFSGDGGAATNAAFNGPMGVAVDSQGNFFIADRGNNRIRKVDADGVITTVAGNGSDSFSGDGAAATNAAVFYPWGVAVDNQGNLFIGDYGLSRIFKINTNGIITTVAGNGINDFSGDGGVATNAALYGPIGVAVDAYGNLFIADANNFRIRKVNTNGIITTVAGNGTNSFSGDGGAATNASFFPMGIAMDASGNLFIADPSKNRVRKVDANGIITTVAGNGSTSFSGDGGVATNATLYDPVGVSVDSQGNLFIADGGNNRVRKVDANGIITTVAGNGSTSFSGDGGVATNATLYGPVGVSVDSQGNLFIADSNNSRIRKVNTVSSLPSLILNNVATTNAGNYSIIITSSSGSVTSFLAALTVVLSPASRTNGASSTASFTTTAFSPESLNFQWQKNRTNLTDGGNISGSTNSTLTVANVQDADAATYSAIVSDATTSVTTFNAVLTVVDPPVITQQPTNQIVLIGRAVAFGTSLTG